MRFRLGLVVLVLAAAAMLVWRPWAAPTFRVPAGVDDLAERLSTAVPRAMRGARVPGAAVAVVHDGRVAWVRGFGRGIGPDTRFQAGSLSKAVTAWGVTASPRAGGLPLDRPVADVLRPWPLPASAQDPAGVTPRRLLSHTAGVTVGGYAGIAPPAPVGSTLDSLRGTGGEGRATAVRLTDEPGSTVRYAGGGYTLLQAAIERRTGERFAAWARGSVLVPLGMRDSAFGPLTGRDVATGHDAGGAAVPDYRYAELAAAGLTSTARDMGRFAAALLRDPDRLGTPQPATGGAYGLGLDVARLDGGARRLWHDGVNRGFNARLLAYPDSGWAVVVLTDGDGGGAVCDAVQAELED